MQLSLEQILAWVKVLSDTYGLSVMISAIITISVFGAFLSSFFRKS